jgi:hypothetical protein
VKREDFGQGKALRSWSGAMGLKVKGLKVKKSKNREY